MPTVPLETQEKTDAAAAAKAEGDKPIAAKSPLANFITDSLGIKPKTAEKKKPKDDDETGDEPPELPKPKKKAPSTPAPAAIDEEKLGRSIAAGLAPHLKGAPVDDAPKDEPAVDPKEKRRLDILLHMEQMPEFTARYKGLAERFKTNRAKLRDYTKAWEAKNPGDKFNDEDAEHADFLDKLEKEVEYDDEDFHEAAADRRLALKLEEKKTEMDERISEIERRGRITDEKPKAEAIVAESCNTFWKELGDDFKDVITRGQPALDELREADPVQADVLEHHAKLSQAYAHQVFLLGNKLVKPKNDEFHAKLVGFALEEEQEFLKLPRQKQLDDEGRQFTTRAKWDAMSEAERDRHWIFQTDDLIYLAPRHCVKKAKEILAKEEEKFTARAKARGLLARDESPSAGKRASRLAGGITADDDDDLDAGGTRKPLSPSSAASPKSAVLKGLGGAGAKTGLDRWVADSIG